MVKYWNRKNRYVSKVQSSHHILQKIHFDGVSAEQKKGFALEDNIFFSKVERFLSIVGTFSITRAALSTRTPLIVLYSHTTFFLKHEALYASLFEFIYF